MTVEQAEIKYQEILRLFEKNSVDFKQLATLFNDFCSEYPSSIKKKDRDPEFKKEFVNIKAKLLKIVAGMGGANDSKSEYTAIIVAKLTPLATTALSLAKDTSQLNPTSRKEQRFCEQVSQILRNITLCANQISYKNTVLIAKKQAISQTLIDQLSPIWADFQVKSYQFIAKQSPAIEPVHTETNKADSELAVTAAKMKTPAQAKKPEQKAQPASPASAISVSPPPQSASILPSKEPIEERSPEYRVSAFEQELGSVLENIKGNTAYAKITKRYLKDKSADGTVEKQLSKLESAINKLLTSPFRWFYPKRTQDLEDYQKEVRELRQEAVNIRRGIERETKSIHSDLLINSYKLAQRHTPLEMTYEYMLQDLEDKSISEAMQDQFPGKAEHDANSIEIIAKAFPALLKNLESQIQAAPGMFASHEDKQRVTAHNTTIKTKITALKADHAKILDAYKKAEERLATEQAEADRRKDTLSEEKAELEGKLTKLEAPRKRLSEINLDITQPQKKSKFGRSKDKKLETQAGNPPKHSDEIFPPLSSSNSNANNSAQSTAQPEPGKEPRITPNAS